MSLLLTLAAATAFLPTAPLTQDPGAGSRVRIVPQTSDERLEDIEESRDGTRMLTHDRGFAPRLWDPRSMKLLKVLGGANTPVSYVAFSADGSRIVCLSEPEIAVWESKSARLKTVLSVPGEKFTAAAISPDGKTVVTGTASGKLMTWACEKPESPSTLAASVGNTLQISFSPDGKRYVAASSDHKARVVESGKVIATLEGHADQIRWAFFSGDSSRIVTTGLDNQAIVHEAATGKTLFKRSHIIGPKGFMPNTLMSALWVGKAKDELLVAETDGTMTILDGATGIQKRQLKGHTKSLREIRRSEDGLKVATYGNDEQLLIWDTVGAKALPYKRQEKSSIGAWLMPTAGEFSADSQYWWLGHEDGTILKHDLVTGDVKTQVLGTVQRLYGAEMKSRAKTLWVLLGHAQVFYQLDNLNRDDNAFYTDFTLPTFSQDGRLAWRYFEHPETKKNTAFLFDTVTMRGRWSYADEKRAYLSPDGEVGALLGENGQVSFMSTANPSVPINAEGKTEFAWIFKNEKSPKWRIRDFEFSPDGKTVAHLDGPRKQVVVWEWRTGKQLWTIDTLVEPTQIAYSPDGTRLFLLTPKHFTVYDIVSGKLLAQTDHEDIVESFTELFVSANGKRAWIGDRKVVVWDAETAKILVNRKSRTNFMLQGGDLSDDGKRALIVHKNFVEVVDVDTDKVLMQLDLLDDVVRATWTDDGARILTVDDTDGVTIWSPEPVTLPNGKKTGKKMGSFVVMRDGTWLAWDPEGRYDAQDPTNVPGAVFVMEWDGGLEPIAVGQLKSQFYEPGLLAKMLGQDKEPPRPVPNLDSLRLYPEAKLEAVKDNPLAADVSLEERDEGGIGKVAIFLNGKQVLTRRGAGFFRFDAADYVQFLLPETHLPKGQGNLLQVTVTNESGDLESMPVTLDLGVPANLKAPDVKLHALCVGVGNYVGQRGDLLAPPSDAMALGNALKVAGDRLLPGRVNLTVLESDAKDAASLPTRDKILAWFKETAAKAASTDIVLVFFSGHGVNKLGDQTGYFFLTPEADPTDANGMTAANASISGETLKELLTQIPANKQVVILDTCHSGAAASNLVGAERSLSGDYRRAWESIKDATGTWMLAGSAADQLSYESANVEHGMLTYALLEAIDRATPDGLRQAPSGELFVDVEKWLAYAAGRVESLKNEVGLAGVQRPEFKRSRAGSSFDIGVTKPENRGAIGLKPPKPIVIVGEFEMDKEDPAGLEEIMRSVLRESDKVKAWFEVAKHPNVYRVAGSYELDADALKLKVYLQAFDGKQVRKTLESFEIVGSKTAAQELAAKVRAELESRVKKYEDAKAKPAA